MCCPPSLSSLVFRKIIKGALILEKKVKRIKHCITSHSEKGSFDVFLCLTPRLCLVTRSRMKVWSYSDCYRQVRPTDIQILTTRTASQGRSCSPAGRGGSCSRPRPPGPLHLTQSCTYNVSGRQPRLSPLTLLLGDRSRKEQNTVLSSNPGSLFFSVVNISFLSYYNFFACNYSLHIFIIWNVLP